MITQPAYNKHQQLQFLHIACQELRNKMCFFQHIAIRINITQITITNAIFFPTNERRIVNIDTAEHTCMRLTIYGSSESLQRSKTNRVYHLSSIIYML